MFIRFFLSPSLLTFSFVSVEFTKQITVTVSIVIIPQRPVFRYGSRLPRHSSLLTPNATSNLRSITTYAPRVSIIPYPINANPSPPPLHTSGSFFFSVLLFSYIESSIIHIPLASMPLPPSLLPAARNDSEESNLSLPLQEEPITVNRNTGLLLTIHLFTRKITIYHVPLI